MFGKIIFALRTFQNVATNDSKVMFAIGLVNAKALSFLRSFNPKRFLDMMKNCYDAVILTKKITEQRSKYKDFQHAMIF